MKNIQPITMGPISGVKLVDQNLHSQILRLFGSELSFAYSIVSYSFLYSGNKIGVIYGNCSM